MNILSAFTYKGAKLAVTFIETTTVTEGVECDVYAFTNDSSKDLGIIRIKKGARTPKQLIVEGEQTIEGLVSGNAQLHITRGDSTYVHDFTESGTAPVSVAVGEIMQWQALEDSILYELCIPAYKDGRFKNL